MTATIRRVARPRGELTPAEVKTAQRLRERAEGEQANYRSYVVLLLANGRSFAEVSKATSLSTNTLQRWKRESQ